MNFEVIFSYKADVFHYDNDSIWNFNFKDVNNMTHINKHFKSLKTSHKHKDF